MTSAFAVIVRFEVKPDTRQAFMTLLHANAQTSIATEPDCLRFDVVEPEPALDEVWLYEVYADRAAFEQQHLKAPHFLGFDTATRDMVVRKTVTAGHVTETGKP